MKKIIYFILFSIGLIYSPNVNSQIIDKNELEAKIDALVPTQVNDSTPGLVIGIVQKGKLIFSKGYGLANLSYGIPNDSKMVYNIGSVSKQFLGYAFAMLHVEGKLSIDDPVNKYMEDWPEFEHIVTLRHLLTHTSGYREAYTMSNLAGRIIGVDRLSREECLEVVRKQPQLEFVPGSRYTYNSTAWVILAEVLAKVTGHPADEWVENNILRKLEMNDTQIESYVGEVINNTAESYSYNKERGYINEESNRAIFGAAEVYTSIQDLVKWINNYRTAEIGGKAVNDLFLDPFIFNNGLNVGLSSEYALGIGNSTYRGLKRYRHTGGHEAFSTQLSYYPDQDLGIITISNFGGRGRLATSKVAELLLEEQMTSEEVKEYPKVEIEKNKVEQFTGFYLVPTRNNSTFNLTIVNDTLTINDRAKLIPTSENTFLINGTNSLLKFEYLSKEKIEFTDQSGKKHILIRIDKWTPSKSELTSFEGDYWSDELETVYHVIVKEEKLTMQHRWNDNIVLDAISKDFFKTNWGYTVKFNRNNEGDISGLSINSGRTLNVIFQRKK
ncbi:MAG: CubicO group peptidase (beta-lactamase class C family) [Polaribacter sp.]|jgi:CubicO group peptidase (beta-lactamase class C family)